MARRAFAVRSVEVRAVPLRQCPSGVGTGTMLSFKIRRTNNVGLKFKFLFVPVLSHNRTTVPSAEWRLQHFGGGTV